MSHGRVLALEPLAGETRDAMCGVWVLQPEKGYRFNLDPLLLASFVGAGGVRGKVIDLGTGSAIVPLVLVRKYGARAVTAVELQPRLFALAQRNIQLNRFERAVSLLLGDLRQVETLLPAESYDHVVCNPPFQDPTEGEVSQLRERALARHAITATLDDLCAAAYHLLKPKGRLSLVFPAARLPALSAALVRQGLHLSRLRPVYPRAGRPSNRILVEAVRAPRALELMAPLVLHSGPGKEFTDEVRQMLCEAPVRSGVRRRALALAARAAVLR